MPPKRPTRAIPIINPNSTQPHPPPPAPPAPPLPTTKTTPASPRINPAYQYLKPILESIDPAKIPTVFPGIEPFTRPDPLHHILTRVFLPYKCETTTPQERFAAFHAAITPSEWDLAFKWKICLEMNAHTLKILHAAQGPDAVVSLAMKRWAQRIFGHTLEETWAFAAGYSSGQQPHPLGLSAVYGDNPVIPPVYHFSEQQQDSIYGGFPPCGVFQNRGNMYNPQRTPLQSRGSQFQGPHLQGVPIPRAVPLLPQRQLHYATSLPHFSLGSPNPETESQHRTPHRFPVVRERYLPYRPPIAAARPSSPVPNPSGRNTPPHKRSPKKKKKKVSAVEKVERSSTDDEMGTMVSSWTKAGRNIVPGLIVDKWAKGKGQDIQEDQEAVVVNQSEKNWFQSVSPGPGPGVSSGIRHLRYVPQRNNTEDSPPALRPQDRTKSTANKLDKRKGKQQTALEIQKDQITSNGKDSPTVPQPKVHATPITRKGKRPPSTGSQKTGSVEGSSKARQLPVQPSSQLIVKTLPNGKKQVVEQILQPTNAEGSSTVHKPLITGWGKIKVPSSNTQVKNLENTYHAQGQETLKVAISENDIDEFMAKSQTRSDIVKKPKLNDQVSILVKAEGTNKLLAKPPAQVKGLSGASKMLLERWEKAKQERDRKGQALGNGEGSSNGLSDTQSPRQVANLISEGKPPTVHNLIPKRSSWLTNDPGLPSFVKLKAPVATKIAYPKPLTSTKTPVVPTSIQHKNTGQSSPSEVLPVTPKQSNFTEAFIGTNGKPDTPGVVFSTECPSSASPTVPPFSPPDYAKAASGPNGRNMDQRPHTPPASPSENPLTVPMAPTKAIITPIKLTASPPSTPTKGPPENPTPLKSGKSWSSIVTGNAADLNVTNKNLQRDSIAIEGFPELGKPLTTLQPNQLPKTPHDTWAWAEVGLNQKVSLSAMAKPFEPAGPRHAASADSYLKASNCSVPPVMHAHIPTLPAHPAAPSMIQYPTPTPPVAPILLPQAPTEHMSFPFDHLLETFYNMPEFTKYLNSSYNELLFKENYLRAQYQRISETFVEEWDYITTQQRRAIVAKAFSNLSQRVDKVQFSHVTGVDSVLRDLGLTKYPLPTIPLLRRPTNLNLRDTYLQGASANEETREESSKFTREAYLKWRAEYCFDCDPDPLCISPDWLYSIISRLLGMPHTLRHRFGPIRCNKNSDYSATSDYEVDGMLEGPELWCPDDCLDCKEAEHTGWPTEWTFVRNSWNPIRDNHHQSSSDPSSPMLERFLDEMEVPEGYFSEAAPFAPPPPPPQNSLGDRRNPFMFSRLSILKKARLMSNRFTDPIFARSDEWQAANPGRAKFMELMNIDIALFYCELIEEILQIFGEVRRERVWITLPTTTDYYDGLPVVPSQPIRGRPRIRSPGKESSRIRTSTTLDSLEQKQAKNRREEVRTRVLEERKRMWEFVKEVQRTMDWNVAGLKLVDRDTDREVERAHDGGLWTVPVPLPEKEMLEREFSKLCV